MRTLLSLFCSVLAAYAALSSPIRDNSAARNLDYISDSEIVPIAYLESTGEQYINTGFLVVPFLSIEIDAQLMSPIVPNFGGRGASWNTMHCFASSGGNYGYGIGGKVYTFADFDPTERFTLVYNARSALLTIDGFEPQSINWNFSSTSIDYTLFGYNLNGTVTCSNWRIYSFKCYNYRTGKSLNLIPVRVGSVGFMLDQVSGTLFGNMGYGDFILGPDL